MSGFDRFAGIEGLRGCCYPRAITSDRIPLVRTQVPEMLQYPLVKDSATFVQNLCKVMYGGVGTKVGAVKQLVRIGVKGKGVASKAA